MKPLLQKQQQQLQPNFQQQLQHNLQQNLLVQAFQKFQQQTLQKQQQQKAIQKLQILQQQQQNFVAVPSTSQNYSNTESQKLKLVEKTGKINLFCSIVIGTL